MLELFNIKKDYYVGDMVVNALKGINLSFRTNEFVSILGPSGCGKTTLLNIVGGLDHYTNGDLVIDNVSTKSFKDRDWDTYRNHRIGFVFQSYNLISHQTILENVELALTIAGLKKEERVKKAKKALDLVGLEGLYNKKGNQLSGGQQQRVAIARALVNEPDILLADEPTGALDSETSVQIMDLMKEISKNKLIIMVTHNPDLACQYSTRIIKLKDGLVIEDSNPLSEEEYNHEKEVKNAKVVSKKAKLNYWQTFRLSSRNLLSKFKRTFLVAFAGSIGIIGVSTVLAVSTGIQGYIKSMQDDMLSGNPITISTETYDLALLMSNMTYEDKVDLIEDATDQGIINVDYLIESLIKASGTMDDAMIHNDITEEYIRYLNNLNPELYADITYDYGINFLNNIYTTSNFTNQEGELMSLSGMTQVFSSMLQQTDFSEYSMLIPTIAQPLDQSLNNEEYILNQYEIVSDEETSYLPKEENEIMIVLSGDDALTDLTLGQLGYYSQEEFFNVVYRAAGNDRYDPDLDKNHFTFDELMDKEFVYYPNDDIYDRVDLNLTLPVEGQTVNASISHLYKPYAKDIKDEDGNQKERIPLKVTAILRPKDGVTYGSLSSGFYYTPALVERMIKDSIDSEIVNYVKNELKTDSLDSYIIVQETGEGENKKTTVNVGGVAYMYNYFFEGEEYKNKFGLVGDLSMTSGNNQMLTYRLSLSDLGGSDLPYSISIYPKDFNIKQEIVDYLNHWNSDETLEFDGITITPEERSEVIYSDNLQLIINLINDMINIVTYALIAFTALSLVVSTVMIAIITYVSVVERVKEIGVIRSLGGRKKDVSRLFYSETIIEGLASGLLGIAITFLLEFILNVIVGTLIGVYTIANLTWYQALIMIALSILLTSISGLLPARAAARKDPAEALRTE